MIKHFLKIFIASLMLITILLSVTALGYIILIDRDIVIGTMKNVESKDLSNKGLAFSSTFNYNTPLGKIAKTSKRLNILLVGLENQRTDTIMVLSYDSESNIADIISIPRDTYYPRDVYDRPDTKKINAVYSGEGIEGLSNSIQDILGIPIEKYVIVDYNGVVACVDLLGGVEVEVPFHMKYSDPYDDPPLHIDIPEGRQLLNGEQSLKFLRFRKGYDNQDLGRIEAQQRFMKSAVKKALSLQLPSLINEAYSYIETNLSLTDYLGLAGNIIGFSTENINLHIMPGTETPLEGLSFYVPDEDEIKKLIYSMYGMNNDYN
ncbi:LCP family protein [Sedimentibacter sp. MB31-C6]|uniref:LCP family protein n=1 Tax=Sedimentibacter sp. MB31-C6 TaxID=3109366 RepID=UPI002DDDB6D2|nr:LCP family protein [Sedimentibacter sp. MB36-C1]WSI03441.1 LCP family protein [Sedimentibacter sp. MB36-C1]